jgi:serine/threonine protein kinase
MGEIYLAHQHGAEGFQREVVIKRIHHRLLGSSQAVKMFLEEAQLSSLFNHPNLVHVYDVCEEDGAYFIVMEPVYGTNLRRFAEAMTRRGAMIPFNISINIILQVLEGVRYAQRFPDKNGRPMKIVHRDICPTNILISYDGVVKLADFGIARPESQLRHEAGFPLGKFAYMSPEMIQRGTVDTRSDLRSIGILLYELTVGQRLFRASSLEEMRRMVHAPIPPPTFIRPGYPADLEMIVMRALEKKPEDRYESAEKMLKALEAFVFKTRLRLSRVDLGGFALQLMTAAEKKVIAPASIPSPLPTSPTEDASLEELDFDGRGIFKPIPRERIKEKALEQGLDPRPQAEGPSSLVVLRQRATSSLFQAITQAKDALADLDLATEQAEPKAMVYSGENNPFHGSHGRAQPDKERVSRRRGLRTALGHAGKRNRSRRQRGPRMRRDGRVRPQVHRRSALPQRRGRGRRRSFPAVVSKKIFLRYFKI